MSDQTPQNAPSGDAARWLEPGRQNVQLIYILYLVSLAVGLTSIVGLVLAYLNRDRADPWLQSHYTFAIRTFWIGILYVLVCALLAFFLIGFLLMFVVLVWFVIRCVKGLQAVTSEQPVSNPETWLI